MASFPSLPGGIGGNIVIDTSKLFYTVDWSATIKKFKADGYRTSPMSYYGMNLVSHVRKKLLSAYSVSEHGGIAGRRYGYLDIYVYTYPRNYRVVRSIASLDVPRFYDSSLEERLGGGIEKLGGGI